MVHSHTLPYVAMILFLAPGSYAGQAADSKEDDFNRVFDAPIEQVYLAATRVAASEWHLKYADKDTYTLSFSTGMNWRTFRGFDVSVVCIPLEDGRTKVTLHGQRRTSFQLFSWKEGNRVGSQFLRALAEQIQKTPTPTNAATAERESSAAGTVIIRSVPEGADVLVDGTFMGMTPATITLVVGDHVIRVEREGFKDWERTLAVTTGAKLNLDAAMESLP